MITKAQDDEDTHDNYDNHDYAWSWNASWIRGDLLGLNMAPITKTDNLTKNLITEIDNITEYDKLTTMTRIMMIRMVLTNYP